MTISGVYLVTSEPRPGVSLLDVIDAAVGAGVQTVQLRAKQSSARAFLTLVEDAASVLHGRARLVVNDRIDVVLAAREAGIVVDGAHVGQSDLPVNRVRALLGADSMIGLTANTSEHLAGLADEGAELVDYLGVGAVHPTATKADHPPTIGVGGFATFAAAAPLPCVAIGGVTVADVAPLRRAGARAIAVASAICSADDPARAAADLVRAWDRAGVSA